MGQVNYDTVEYLQGCAIRELWVVRCDNCGTWIHPPKRTCPACWSESVSHRRVDGSARIVSFSRPRGSPDSSVSVPACAVVEFSEFESVRILAQLIDEPHGGFRLGMAVVLDWKQADNTYVPVFRPVDPQS